MKPFANNSVFNAPLEDNALLDVTSAELMTQFVSEARTKGTINTTSWSVPVYPALPGASPVKVTQVRYEPVPTKPPVNPTNPKLQEAWNSVPIPPGAVGANGTDKHCVVWQPSTDKLWEFYHLEKTTTGEFTAEWGGAINEVSTNPGAYDAGAYAPYSQNSWGASACSISIAAGLITLDDLEKGKIDHALAIAVPTPRKTIYVAPAKRTDGGSSLTTSLPEGAHIRLDPKVNLDALEMPKLTRMLAEAAQKYGMIVRDSAGSVPFYAEDPTRLGVNPYIAGPKYFESRTPAQLLAFFPWKHCQLLSMNLL